MPTASRQTWIGYLDMLNHRNFDPDELKIEGLEKILNINQLTHAVFNHSIPWIYLLDYTSGKYMLISKSMKIMLGFEPDYFLKGGVLQILENYHDKHLQLLNEEIFPDRLAILKKIPPTEHGNYIFSYNFQYRTKKGEYMNLLQRNCFVKSDENGNPLMSFGVITNVNHFKKENPVIQVVEKIGPESFFDEANTISKKVYYLNKEDQLFTKREKELLLWIADGLTSKEIADKLNLSEYTVINHRRNMMDKSNSKSITELISFALRRDII